MSRRQSIIDTILNKVKVVANAAQDDGYCWQWTGPTSGHSGRGKGYPRMSLNGQTVAVHRVMFVCEFGYVPSKKQIDHKCRNRLCVNPSHLRMVTHKKNCKLRDEARNENVLTD